MLLNLLKTRWRVIHNGLNASDKKGLAAIGIAVSWIGLTAWIFIFVSATIALTGNKGLSYILLNAHHLTFLFTAFFLLSTVINGQILSKEIKILQPLPISLGTIFSYKYVEYFMEVGAFTTTTILTTLLALQRYVPINLGHYLLAIICSLLLSSITVSITIVVAMVLVRYVPKKILFLALYLVSISFYFLFIAHNERREAFRDRGGAHSIQNRYPKMDLSAYTDQYSYLPSHFAGETIASGIGQNSKGVALNFFFLICMSAGLFLLSKRFFIGFIEKSWDKHATTAQKKTKITIETNGHRNTISFLPPDLMTTMAKDLKIIYREQKILIQVGSFFMMFVAMFIGNSFRHEGGGLQAIAFQLYLGLGVILPILAFELGCLTIPSERTSFWCNLALPLPAKLVVRSKHLVSWLLSGLLLSIGMAAVSYFGFASRMEKLGLLILSGSGLSLASALGIYTGLINPNFKWENQPLQKGSIMGAMFGMMLLTGLVVGIFYLGKMLFSLVGLTNDLSGLIVALILSPIMIAVAETLLKSSQTKILAMEWNQ